MTKPPAGASLLFGALADSGQIKQRKNGSYRMVLDGVDEIDWFTDRPNRVAGEWSPRKLVKKWESLFGDVEPNAQATIELDSKRKLVIFEMSEPKINEKGSRLSFNIVAFGKKNMDAVTGIEGQGFDNTSLFIDSASSRNGLQSIGDGTYIGEGFDSRNCSQMNTQAICYPDCSNQDFSNRELIKYDFDHANLTNADLKGATLTDTILTFANLTGANLAGAKFGGVLYIGAIWNNTTCPDGTKNSDTSPCTAEQLQA